MHSIFAQNTKWFQHWKLKEGDRGTYSIFSVFLCRHLVLIKKKGKNRGISKCWQEEACYPAPTFGEDWKACRQEDRGKSETTKWDHLCGAGSQDSPQTVWRSWGWFSHPHTWGLCSFEYSGLLTIWDFYVINIYYVEWFYFQIYCILNMLFNGLIQMQGAHHSWVEWLEPIQGLDNDLLSITFSTKYLHCTCLEPLMRQIWFSHQTLPFNYSSHICGSCQVRPAASGLLAGAGTPNGCWCLECRNFVWQQILLQLNIHNYKLKGNLCPRECAFSLQVLNDLWEWTIGAKNLKSDLRVCTLATLALKPCSPSWLPDS